MNVPTLGERTLRRDIADSKLTTGSEIQVITFMSVAYQV